MTQKVGMTKSNMEKKRCNAQEKWISQNCQLNIYIKKDKKSVEQKEIRVTSTKEKERRK